MSLQRNIHYAGSRKSKYWFGYKTDSDEFYLRKFLVAGSVDPKTEVDIPDKGILVDDSELVSIQYFSELSGGVLIRNWNNVNISTQITLFPYLKTVGVSGLEDAYKEVQTLREVEFPALQSVDDYGLSHAFKDCSNLTGDIYFPRLRELGRHALYHMFEGTKVATVHFAASMKDAWEAMLTPEYLGLAPLKDSGGNFLFKYDESGNILRDENGNAILAQQVFFDADLMWNPDDVTYNGRTGENILMWIPSDRVDSSGNNYYYAKQTDYVYDEDIHDVDSEGYLIDKETGERIELPIIMWGNRYKG